MKYNLDRFHIAQENSYKNAWLEIKNGKKTSHWMWYIFPQIKGLGKSDIARKFEIENSDEAVDYLKNSVLAERIIELTRILVEEIEGKTAEEIFGFPDYLKFQSSMTLFKTVVVNNSVIFPAENYKIFGKALDQFYKGELDLITIELLSKTR
ncbi:DUF1810 domain-containing protein [Kaistella jeonii]|uniref:Calpastatin n=1 Tax=Kaistella jeonii TaxID=266749 RepID=A0A0C1FBK3_9FLAO|nr:DUF1810 family protein [Kaistella jeonii]KIA90482.1 hypothetical protein OA86_00885 [Kaistella jeonii]SFB72162.1 Uncharacterized protein, DUF1810 family [Kaistella jeonii]VEI94946.1 Uncharacterized conserved protein [Kaistella jeonii]